VLDPVAAFRPATLHDADAVVGLMRAYYAEDGYAFDEHDARQAFGALLADPTLGRAWVAVHDGSIVAYVILTLGYSLEFRGRDAFVDELYVTPHMRSRGLGRAALALAEDASRDLGVRALHLEVERNKVAALSLYRRRGFVNHDRYLMTKHLVTAILAMLLAACGPADDAAAGATSAAAPPASAAWTVTETGWGPIRAGMSVADARAALGGELPGPVNPECDHVKPPGAPPGLLLMVARGQVARVEVSDSAVATSAGARVGDAEARINALYPGRVETRPHKYVDGHYLIVRRRALADSLHRLVFETDGQRVTRYRGGRVPEIEWVEGCS
jgi:ribosomal protein S18 acetylase RimI-like enzyme